MSRFVALSLALAIAGCSGASGSRRASSKPFSYVDDNGHVIHCRREVPLGSHIPELICNRVADVEALRERTQTGLSLPGPPGADRSRPGG